MFGGCYRNRRILITGHTGFKGAWLGQWLHGLGARVSGFSDRSPDRHSLGAEQSKGIWCHDLRGDIGDLPTVRDALRGVRPELVFHLAAQPLVRLSYRQPLATLQTNVMGTANVLDAVLRQRGRVDVVVVTSDKCYENRHWHHGYRETDALGGHDVYSASKAAAELVVQAWRRSFFQAVPARGNVATARGGNVIGGGDYAADRIVPDCVRALRARRPIEVRNPAATRPWQHVLDCLSGYLALGWHVTTSEPGSCFADAFNFGPPQSSNRPVQELVEAVLESWPGRWKHVGEPGAPHEATLLHLATDKAARLLQWSPVWDFPTTVRKTMDWYRARHGRKPVDMVGFSAEQIAGYAAQATAQAQVWATPVK